MSAATQRVLVFAGTFVALLVASRWASAGNVTGNPSGTVPIADPRVIGPIGGVF